MRPIQWVITVTVVPDGGISGEFCKVVAVDAHRRVFKQCVKVLGHMLGRNIRKICVKPIISAARYNPKEQSKSKEYFDAYTNEHAWSLYFWGFGRMLTWLMEARPRCTA